MTSTWLTAWSQAVTDCRSFGVAIEAGTLRLSVPMPMIGDRLRLVLSNRFGDDPLRVAAAAVRLGPATATVSFAGALHTEVPAGAILVSDPVEVKVPAGTELHVDLELPERTPLQSGALAGAAWQHAAAPMLPGTDDFVAGPALTVTGPDGPLPAPAPFLERIDVERSASHPVVACFGDSITAAGWPERAARLLGDLDLAVVNRGIPGGRLRFPGAGPMGAFFGRSGLDRFDDDVLGTAGATHVILALGTNDLGHPGVVAPAQELPTAEQLLDAIDELQRRARAAGIEPIIATMTPFLPARGYDEARERIRTAVNDAARGGDSPVIDFDAALRSAEQPSRLADELDSGDHLHPSDAGQQRLAEVAADAIRARLGERP